MGEGEFRLFLCHHLAMCNLVDSPTFDSYIHPSPPFDLTFPSLPLSLSLSLSSIFLLSNCCIDLWSSVLRNPCSEVTLSGERVTSIEKSNTWGICIIWVLIDYIRVLEYQVVFYFLLEYLGVLPFFHTFIHLINIGIKYLLHQCWGRFLGYIIESNMVPASKKFSVCPNMICRCEMSKIWTVAVIYWKAWVLFLVVLVVVNCYLSICDNFETLG